MASPSPRQGDAECSSQSKQLAEALGALLEPLQLNHGLELHRTEEETVHVRRRGDGLHRQELCFIRLEEAPPPPPKPPVRGVRIGGGYYIPELERSAAREAAERREERQKARLGLNKQKQNSREPSAQPSDRTSAQEEVPQSSFQKRLSAALDASALLSTPPPKGQAQSPGPVLLGRPSSAAPSPVKCESAQETRTSEDEDIPGTSGLEDIPGTSGFVHGAPPRSVQDDVYGAGYHFGTYTRGETRFYRGDRRQRAGGKHHAYDDTVGPAPRGDATFRVLSSERRKRQRQSSSLPCPQGDPATEPCWSGPGSEALDCLLDALGLDLPADAEVMPEVHRSQSCVAGRWRVEFCYVCADRTAEKTVEKPVEVVVERKVEVPVHVEVEAPRPQQVAAGCQTSMTTWCANCGAPGHKAPDCPLLQLQKQLRQAQLREKQLQESLANASISKCCQLCGAATHQAPDCPLMLKRKPAKDQCVQTDLCCQLCGEFGHAAPKCPLLAELLHGKGGQGGQGDGRPAKLRVGGGWLLAPEVPGLGQPGLDEVAALKALAAANAAGSMGQDGRVHYHGPSRPAERKIPRPRSAPAGGRRSASAAPPSQGQATQTPQASPRRLHQAKSFAPKEAQRFLGPGHMGPERFKKMEQERAALTARIRSGQHQSPERNRGYIFGTYVQGAGDRHRFSSDRGPRAAFRVLRSSITKDATLDPEALRKTSVSSLSGFQEADSSIAHEDEDDTASEVPVETSFEASRLVSEPGWQCPEIFVTPATGRPPPLKGMPPEPTSGMASTCSSTRVGASNCDVSVCSGPSMLAPTSLSDIAPIAACS